MTLLAPKGVRLQLELDESSKVAALSTPCCQNIMTSPHDSRSWLNSTVLRTNQLHERWWLAGNSAMGKSFRHGI